MRYVSLSIKFNPTVKSVNICDIFELDKFKLIFDTLEGYAVDIHMYHT